MNTLPGPSGKLNPDTKRQLVETGVTIGIIAATLVGGVYLSERELAPRGPAITLRWQVNEPSSGTITEVWASTNLHNWTLRTNVIGTNTVTLPRDKPAEYFKIRNRLGSQVSDWARVRP